MKWSFFAAAVLFLSSCSKTDTPEPDPITPIIPADTLNSWTKHPTGVIDFISDIAFVNPAKGYIVHDMALMGSLDSGKTWTPKLTGTRLWVMNFFDQQFGYAVGFSTFAYTNNGGSSWSTRAMPTVAYDVIFTSHTTGVYVGTDGIYRTTNTGVSWTQVMPGSWTALYFKNASEGWASQNSGALHKTVDGGITWSPVAGSFPPRIDAIGFSGQFGIATASGSFVRTTDNGLTWQSIPGYTGQFIDVEVLSPTLVYITAGKEIRKSTDGGNTWTREMKLGAEDLIELNFIDSLHGWAAGMKGSVVRYVKQ